MNTAELADTIKEYKLNPSIVLAGKNQDQVIIKTIKALDNEKREEVIKTISKKYNITDKDVLASEQFGPTVGKELKSNAIKSVIIASIGMLIYIIFRFKSWKYGISSVAGLLHDVLVILAIYGLFNITINNPFIAGILTVVGYSINDTIVTTLICMVPLTIMVSSSIREFVIPLMVGVLVGTYSSIFLCSPVLYDLSKNDNKSKYQLGKEQKEKRKASK